MAYAFVRNSNAYTQVVPSALTSTMDSGSNGIGSGMQITLKAAADRLVATGKALSEDAAPCARVFGTTELQEQILLKLPLRSVLRAQGVSRCWRDLIKYSSMLRQALFLTPAKPTMVWTLADKEAESPSGPGGSGLLGPAAGLHDLDELVPIREAEDVGIEYVIQAKANGIVPYRHLHFSQRLDSSHAVWSFCNYIHPDGPPAETAFSTNINAIKRLHPAYKGMYLSQPPSKAVEMGVYGGGSQALIEKIVMEDPVGVTFQRILDAVERLQAARRTIACLEVALWMKDVSFVLRRPMPVQGVTMASLNLRNTEDGK